MKDRNEKITQYHDMLDAIRVRQKTDINVEHLKSVLNISRTTADKIMTILLSEDKDLSLIQKHGRSIFVRSEAAYFLGISIGSKYIRVSLIGLDFNPVSKSKLLQCKEISDLISMEIMNFDNNESDDSGFSFHTPISDSQSMSSSLDCLRKVISPLVSHFLMLSESTDPSNAPRYPLAGIGFAVAGPVDYTAKTWISAPHITSLRNITIQDLVGYENLQTIERAGIFMSIDNNAKTAIVSEYFQLLVDNCGNYHDDLALIYIGSGIGSAAIINKRLLRGCHNVSGELGQMYLYSPKLDKSATDYASSQEIIPYDMVRLEDLMSSKNRDECCKKWLPYALCSTICILGVKNVILAGHTIRGTKDLIPSLMDERTKFTVSSTSMYCNLLQGRGTPNTAAIGAAIEAYYTMCNFDKENPSIRTNLAFNLSM